MIDLTSQVFQYEIEFAISLKCIEQVDNERTLWERIEPMSKLYATTSTRQQVQDNKGHKLHSHNSTIDHGRYSQANS